MRFLLTLAVWIVTGSVVLMFFVFRGTTSTGTHVVQQSADRDIAVEVTTSFNTDKEQFAYSKEPLISVFMDGKRLYESDDKIIKGRPIHLKVVHLKDGQHEIMVTASAVDDSGDNALRIRAVADGLTIGDNTEWFDSGQMIVSVMRFNLGSKDEE